MTTQAQYLATGQIVGTLFPNIITDESQIAALAAQGISLVIIPDGKSPSTGSIVNGVYQDYPPPPPQIPNIVTQLAAALINNGTVTADQFHPTTIAQLNTALSSVSMTTVSTAAKATSSSSSSSSS